jgi:hypothetical protein
LEVFLALALLLLTYRLSGGLVGLPHGLILRLRLSANLVKRLPGDLATESGRKLLQRIGRDFVRHGEDRVATRRYQATKCCDRLVTRVQALSVVQGAGRGADTLPSSIPIGPPSTPTSIPIKLPGASRQVCNLEELIVPWALAITLSPGD